MQVDDQRITKKDAVFDNVKILNGNQIPLTNTLTGKLPLRGSLIALKSGNIHDLYYGDGLQWVPITDGGSTADPPLVEVLATGNATGGNNIEITNGDVIVSETDGLLQIGSVGASSQVAIVSLGTLSNALQILSEGNCDILSVGQLSLTTTTQATDNAIRINSTNGGIDVDSALQLNLASSQPEVDAVRIEATDVAGGIDIDAGTGGVAIDTSGPIALTSGTSTQSILTMNAFGVVEVQADHFTISSIDGSPDTASHLHTTQGTAPIASSVFTTSLLYGTDLAGYVSTTLSAQGSGCLITFDKPFPSNNYSVLITPGNINAVRSYLYVDDTDRLAGSFVVRTDVDIGQEERRFYYQVIYIE